MQVNIIMQKENENTLANAISTCLGENAKKAYFFIGNFKETGYKIIEDDLIDIKTKLFFAIGIDKKTTTRSMLEGLLEYTDDVYYYSNNNLNEFVSNICIFEYTDRAYVYVSGSNISESGIQTDLSIYTKITYDLKNALDKQEYKNQIKELQKIVDENGFEKLDKSVIEKLVEDKEIFSTRQYNHSFMSISELLGKKDKKEENKKEELSKEEIEDVYKKDVEIPKIDLTDISIDIDIPEEFEKVSPKEEIAIDYVEDKITLPKDIETYEEIKEPKKSDEIDENNELYDESMKDDNIDFNQTLDINDMLFSKADIKLDVSSSKPKKKKVKENEEDENVVKVKKVNLNNITNLIFEVAARTSKEEDSVKVPNQVKIMIPDFFGLDEAENEEVNGSMHKVKHIKLEVVNAKTNEKYTDDDAKITYKPKQSYLTFVSKILENVEYDENDIVRINKLSENEYHMEIIDKKLQEYKVWSKLCNQKFRASTRKFGVM
jgi:hypothetical protein